MFQHTFSFLFENLCIIWVCSKGPWQQHQALRRPLEVTEFLTFHLWASWIMSLVSCCAVNFSITTENWSPAVFTCRWGLSSPVCSSRVEACQQHIVSWALDCQLCILISSSSTIQGEWSSAAALPGGSAYILILPLTISSDCVLLFFPLIFITPHLPGSITAASLSSVSPPSFTPSPRLFSSPQRTQRIRAQHPSPPPRNSDWESCELYVH